MTKYTLPGYVLSVSYVVGILALCLIPNSLFDKTGHTVNHRSKLTGSQYNSSSYPYLLQLEKGAQEGAGLVQNNQTHENPDQESLLEDKDIRPESHPPESITKSKSLKSLLQVPKIVVCFILCRYTKCV